MRGDVPLNSADEWDVFSRYWRHRVNWSRGEVRRIKRTYRRRSRQQAKVTIRRDPEGA